MSGFRVNSQQDGSKVDGKEQLAGILQSVFCEKGVWGLDEVLAVE